MSSETVRHRVWRVLQVDHEKHGVSYYVNLGLAVLIVINIVGICLETIPGIAQGYRTLLLAIEHFSVAVFTIEYLLRLWTCVEKPAFRRPLLGRLKYALTPLALIDLAAITPFFIPHTNVDLMTLRAFRLIRLLRLLKFGRYSEALQLIGRVLAKKRGELASTVVIAGFMLLVAASLLHGVEAETQPDRFGTMPQSLWWAVVTMTTVGYGDVYPQTGLGKFLGAIVALLGIGMFALPTAILGSGFLEETSRRGKQRVNTANCPHCGKSLDAAPSRSD